MEQDQLLANVECLSNIISEMMAEAADGGWQLTDARERQCFAFMEMELSAVVRSLRAPSVGCHGVDHGWLQELRRLAREIPHLLAKRGEADPAARQALLRKASRCFRRHTDLYGPIQHEAYGLHLAAQDPCRCKHLSSDPPHAAEVVAGGHRLVGIKAAAKKLLRWLMAADTSLQFMAIVGPTGVGKTTLAMELLCRLRCQAKYFQCCAAATFPRMREPVRTKLFLRSILSQMRDLEASSSHNSETNEQLAANIWKHLQYKRYYILIDDISKDSDWGTINDAFPADHCGSRILLTTRNELIASCCVSNYDGVVHMMKPLSDADSDRLCRTKAFGSMDYCPPDNLKLLCEEILNKCRGIPLFVTGMAVRVSKLPPQIKRLRILNTLDVSHTHITELPSEVCKLTSLRMLDLRGTQISQLPKQIAMLSYLRTLLVGGYGMINSDETAVVTKIPRTLMIDLHLFTLATVDLSEYPVSFVDALGCQSSLRVLAITWSFHQSTDEAYRKALLSSIKRCKELRSLTIHCALGCSMEFLGSLSDPPKELEKFKVTTGRFVSVPQWIRGLEHLAFLQITVCKLEPDDVKTLGSLRCLKCLILGLEFVPEEEIVIEGEGFKELERFSLDCPVPWLTFKQGAMPMLYYLQLKICSGPANQVSAVPWGLTKLPRITEVVLCYREWCVNSSNVKKTAQAVRKQLARHPNTIDLVINGRQKILTRRHCATESGTKNDVHPLMWPRGR